MRKTDGKEEREHRQRRVRNSTIALVLVAGALVLAGFQPDLAKWWMAVALLGAGAIDAKTLTGFFGK